MPIRQVSPQDINAVLNWDVHVGTSTPNTNWYFTLFGKEFEILRQVQIEPYLVDNVLTYRFKNPDNLEWLREVYDGMRKDYRESQVHVTRVSLVTLDFEAKQVQFSGENGRLSLERSGKFTFEPSRPPLE